MKVPHDKQKIQGKEKEALHQQFRDSLKIIGDSLRPQLDNKCPFCTHARRWNRWQKKLTKTCGDFECANKMALKTARETKNKQGRYWHE